MLQYKQAEIDLKAEAGADMVGYFATFSKVPDRAGDIIAPGAFRNLGAFVKSGWISWHHDVKGVPIGYPVSAIQDAHGLKVAANFHGSVEAQKIRLAARERMAAGLQVPCSIGYKVIDQGPTYTDGRKANLLKTVDLYECSLCNVAANVEAGLLSVKAAAAPTYQGLSTPFPEEFWDWIHKIVGYAPIESGDLARLYSLWLDRLEPPGSFRDGQRGQSWRSDVGPAGREGGNGMLSPGKAAEVTRLRVALLRSRLALATKL